MLKLNSYNPSKKDGIPEFITRRRKTLSHKYELFYGDPLIPETGAGAWIKDAGGQRYLDAYNNVVSVGHANSRVAEAIARQTSRFCSHTRYVNDDLCRLSERLHSKHASGRWRSIFTCSGSEANDLAMRIAMEITGGNGFIVTDHAYHGLTGMTQSVTTSMQGYAHLAQRLGLAIFPVPAPCPSEPGPQRFLAGIQEALSSMRAQGIVFAGAIFDSFFTSDGLAVAPEGFLRQATDTLRRHNGLVIADEVQPGFGRSGTHFWGFQVHDVEPDLITMGKPMGNGYPTAALLLQERLDDYIPDSYFNTFAGNNVAVAAAHAVLDEIEERDLMGNVRQQSQIIGEGLRRLMADYPEISDVRVKGLAIALDISAEDGTPDEISALRIVDAMKERRVLISTSGKAGNTLKIRPLLIYRCDDSEFLLHQLDASLQSVLR